MPVEDVFSIQGRGTVATGRVERGIVRVQDEIEIVGIRDTSKTTVTGVEMFRKLLDEGRIMLGTCGGRPNQCNLRMHCVYPTKLHHEEEQARSVLALLGEKVLFKLWDTHRTPNW